EIQRAQTENRKNIGGINDERISGHCEYRWNAIHCENHIGDLDQNQYDEQGSRHADPILSDKEMVFPVILGDWYPALDPAQHHGVFRMHLLISFEDHLQAGEYQECPKNIDDPTELGDQSYTGKDHPCTHDQGTKHSKEQHAMLIQQRHAEIGKQQREDKHVRSEEHTSELQS